MTSSPPATSAVNTYLANGGKNGAPAADPANSDTFNSLYYSGDTTTPGLVRLPVCSPEFAWRNWLGTANTSEPNYPCNL